MKIIESRPTRPTDTRVVGLGEERAATTVSDLPVVRCGDRDTQPVVALGDHHS